MELIWNNDNWWGSKDVKYALKEEVLNTAEEAETAP
jgi:hypothetical protein